MCTIFQPPLDTKEWPWAWNTFLPREKEPTTQPVRKYLFLFPTQVLLCCAQWPSGAPPAFCFRPHGGGVEVHLLWHRMGVGRLMALCEMQQGECWPEVTSISS